MKKTIIYFVILLMCSTAYAGTVFTIGNRHFVIQESVNAKTGIKKHSLLFQNDYHDNVYNSFSVISSSNQEEILQTLKAWLNFHENNPNIYSIESGSAKISRAKISGYKSLVVISTQETNAYSHITRGQLKRLIFAFEQYVENYDSNN